MTGVGLGLQVVALAGRSGMALERMASKLRPDE